MELQSGISYELNQQRVGKQYKVLIDRVEGDYFIGRSEYDSPEVDNEVLIRKDESTYCRIGDFVEVEISKGRSLRSLCETKVEVMNPFQVGDKVRFLNAEGHGIITKIINDNPSRIRK